MEPLLGLENSTPAQKQFCLPPPPSEPSRVLNPQTHWVRWAKARRDHGSLVSSHFIDKETEVQAGYTVAGNPKKRGPVSPSSPASGCSRVTEAPGGHGLAKGSCSPFLFITVHPIRFRVHRACPRASLSVGSRAQTPTYVYFWEGRGLPLVRAAPESPGLGLESLQAGGP